MIQIFTAKDITEIRRLVTQPSMKTPAEAREALRAFAQEKHKVNSFADDNGKAFLAAIRKLPAGKGILDYMELRE